jgi:hypothetical protein
MSSFIDELACDLAEGRYTRAEILKRALQRSVFVAAVAGISGCGGQSSSRVVPPSQTTTPVSVPPASASPTPSLDPFSGSCDGLKNYGSASGPKGGVRCPDGSRLHPGPGSPAGSYVVGCTVCDFNVVVSHSSLGTATKPKGPHGDPCIPGTARYVASAKCRSSIVDWHPIPSPCGSTKCTCAAAIDTFTASAAAHEARHYADGNDIVNSFNGGGFTLPSGRVVRPTVTMNGCGNNLGEERRAFDLQVETTRISILDDIVAEFDARSAALDSNSANAVAAPCDACASCIPDEPSQTSNDPANCGSCGHRCDANESCVNGQCTCVAPKQRCGSGDCIDLSNDSNNCGRCGLSCGSGYCSGGGCKCRNGFLPCHYTIKGSNPQRDAYECCALQPNGFPNTCCTYGCWEKQGCVG